MESTLKTPMVEPVSVAYPVPTAHVATTDPVMMAPPEAAAPPGGWSSGLYDCCDDCCTCCATCWCPCIPVAQLAQRFNPGKYKCKIIATVLFALYVVAQIFQQAGTRINNGVIEQILKCYDQQSCLQAIDYTPLTEGYLMICTHIMRRPHRTDGRHASSCWFMLSFSAPPPPIDRAPRRPACHARAQRSAASSASSLLFARAASSTAPVPRFAAPTPSRRRAVARTRTAAVRAAARRAPSARSCATSRRPAAHPPPTMGFAPRQRSP